ncbi:hypothetical protein [Enterococcus sp. JM9B]|uniref:hypothetical protein n=1 Tax=Enterococcus sp. JM9B TaxID=1857216 RepID=UPI0013750091|nr:hypothetical protein [Enterococcus sp. JM9B]KAF1304835.1 hypothetical protein BAU16_01295 [Enterococcus sp. JM9B]
MKKVIMGILVVLFVSGCSTAKTVESKSKESSTETSQSSTIKSSETESSSTTNPLDKELRTLRDSNFLEIITMELEESDVINIWVSNEVASMSYSEKKVLINAFTRDVFDIYQEMKGYGKIPLFYYRTEYGTIMGANVDSTGIDIEIVD